jgi:hypothetical protein
MSNIGQRAEVKKEKPAPVAKDESGRTPRGEPREPRPGSYGTHTLPPEFHTSGATGSITASPGYQANRRAKNARNASRSGQAARPSAKSYR